jgi:hypothetical protein
VLNLNLALDQAAPMAGHSDQKTTDLYDRRNVDMNGGGGEPLKFQNESLRNQNAELKPRPQPTGTILRPSGRVQSAINWNGSFLLKGDSGKYANVGFGNPQHRGWPRVNFIETGREAALALILAIFACLSLLANFSFYWYERQLANTRTRIGIYHPNDSDNESLLQLKKQFEEEGFSTEFHCNSAPIGEVHYFFDEDRDRADLVKAISAAFLAAKERRQVLTALRGKGYTAERGPLEIYIPHMKTGSDPKPCPSVPPAPR